MRTRSQTCHEFKTQLDESLALVQRLKAQNNILLQQANAWQVEATEARRKAKYMELSAINQLEQQRLATDRLQRAEEYIRRMEAKFGKLPIEEDSRCDVVDLCDD